MEVANTILRQLGGGRFIMMTGATCYADTNALVVKFKGSKKANYLRIELTPSDLYHMKFLKVWGTKSKEVAEYDRVYADMLRDIFTEVTGLYTKL